METVITVKEQNGKISIKIQTSQPNDENIYDVILRHLTTALSAHIINSPNPDDTLGYAIRIISAYASE